MAELLKLSFLFAASLFDIVFRLVAFFCLLRYLGWF